MGAALLPPPRPRPSYRKVRQERKEDGSGQCFISSHFQAPLGFQKTWQNAGTNGWTPSLISWLVQLVVAAVTLPGLPGVQSLPPEGVSLVCGGAHLEVAGVYGGPPVVGWHAHGTPPGGVGHGVGLGDTSCLGGQGGGDCLKRVMAHNRTDWVKHDTICPRRSSRWVCIGSKSRKHGTSKKASRIPQTENQTTNRNLARGGG